MGCESDIIIKKNGEKNMKIKKIISLITALLMIAAMPVSSFAMNMADEYNVYVNGVQITADNCDDVLGDGGSVKYSNKYETITLTNANITSASNNGIDSWYGLYISSSVNHRIELIGENVIDLRDFQPEDAEFIDQICAVSSHPNLTVYGDGSLTLYTPDCYDSTAMEYDGYLTFDGCKVEIYAGNGESSASGIDYSLISSEHKSVSAENGADVKVYAGDVNYSGNRIRNHAGIRCDNIKVDGTSKIYVETGDINAGKVESVTNAAVTAYAAIVSGELTALAGKVNCESSEKESLSYGIYDLGAPMEDPYSFSRGTIITRGYDTSVYVRFDYQDECKGTDFIVSENVDGSDIDYLDEDDVINDFPYAMICPEGKVVIEKTFFDRIAEFFENLFESIAYFFESIF